MSEYRRVHRISPLLLFWKAILGFLVFIMLNVRLDELAQWFAYSRQTSGQTWQIGAAIGLVFFVACVVVWVISGFWWRAYGYKIANDEISLKHGVFRTKVRTARFDRIQAVDVVENAFFRIFGVATVRVETAGGHDSVLKIELLRTQDAHELREVILEQRHRRGSDYGSDVDSVLVVDNALVVSPIPVWRSLVASLFSLRVLFFAVLWFLFEPLGVAAMVPFVLAVVPKVWAVVDQSWKFSARREDDVLNVSFGLANIRKQSIPLDRIHAVEIRQPLLWRILGWWIVDVSVAGYGVSDRRGGTTRLLPVGTRDEAMKLAAVISPLHSGELEQVAAPEGFIAPDFRSPRRAKWVSPLGYAKQGLTLSERVVVIHEGRLVRRVKMIDPCHIQELTLVRGPVQHLFHVDTVRLDLVRGPVRMSAHDLTPQDAVILLQKLRGRRLPVL